MTNFAGMTTARLSDGRVLTLTPTAMRSHAALVVEIVESIPVRSERSERRWN